MGLEVGPSGVARYLFLVGRMRLRAAEHHLAVAVVPLFWPGSTRIEVARLVVERLYERGVGSAPWSTARTIRRLVERGILTPLGDGLYKLEAADTWAWRPGAYLAAADEWRATPDPVFAWGGQIGLAYDLRKLLDAMGVGATFGPADPVFARWFERVTALAEMYSVDLVTRALREGTKDPESILPATPDGFASELYALALRSRRRRV